MPLLALVDGMIGSDAPTLSSCTASRVRDCDSREPSPRGAKRRSLFVSRLIEEYRGALLRHLTGLLSRPEDAEDVLQETCRRLLDAPRLDPRTGRARAYMFRIATNLAYDRFRVRRMDSFESDGHDTSLACAAQPPDLIVDFNQGLAIIRQTLLSLKPRCRRVFLLRVSEGMSYERIAKILGVSKRTVEREMKCALDACQRRLKR